MRAAALESFSCGGKWATRDQAGDYSNRKGVYEQLQKHTLRWTVPAFLLAGQAAAQSSYDLKSPDGGILKGGALVEDSA